MTYHLCCYLHLKGLSSKFPFVHKRLSFRVSCNCIPTNHPCVSPVRRVGWFLFWWNLALQFLHGFKLFHFVHRFQNCFCFRSTTFPSAVRTFGQRLLVLHCNYNGDVAPKFDLVITFDWGVVLTQGQRVWTAFCKIFSGIPHSPIFSAPKYACQIRHICQIQPNTARCGIWHTYLGEPNMVKWGIPCKKQFRRVDLVSIGPPSQKLWPNQILVRRPHCNYNVNSPRCGVTDWT